MNTHTQAQQRGHDILSQIVKDFHTSNPQVNERIMAVEPLATVDVLAGTFFVTPTITGVEKPLDFYVRTCPAREDSDAGAEEARSKRQDDLNEQYVDVATRLMLHYGERIRYVRTMPDPFF